MSVINFAPDLSKSFAVEVTSFHSVHRPIQVLQSRMLVANAGFIDLPGDQKANIDADQIVFSKQAMGHFRDIVVGVTERLAKSDASAWQAPSAHAKSEFDFLRPIFNQVLQRGETLWGVLRQIREADLPIPNDFLVFLPPADSRNPSRDDIIRAMVPFKRAQRAALQAGWEDETIALRITHNSAVRSAAVYQNCEFLN